MSFDPDPKKPTQEELFLRKNSNIIHPVIHFNNVQEQRANKQKHLGIILDEKLHFKCHVVKTKTSNVIAVIKALWNFLPHKSLITFIKHLLDHILTMEIFCTTNLMTLFLKK